MARLDISLFGPFEAMIEGRPITKFRANKVKALLIYLIVEENQGTNNREKLMALLWPSMPQKSAQQNLRQTIYYLRKFIKDCSENDKNGSGLPVIEGLASHVIEQICYYLQKQWHQNLSINVNWEFVDWPEMVERSANPSTHLVLNGWAADYPDADNFLRVGRKFGLWGNWTNDTYENYVTKAILVRNQNERKRLYEKAERILIEQAPIMPLLYGRLHLLIKPWVTSFPISPIRNWFGEHVIIDPSRSEFL